jgi:hypothetical protein
VASISGGCRLARYEGTMADIEPLIEDDEDAAEAKALIV